MTNQNRSNDSGRFRRSYDNEDFRDRDDDWHREDVYQRGLSSDDAYVRGSRGYSDAGQSARWERGGYSGHPHRFETPERERYGDSDRERDADEDFRGYPVLQGARGYRSEEWKRSLDEPEHVRVGWTIHQRQHGRSRFDTPQYGAVGVNTRARQGREGQQFGGSAFQDEGAWRLGVHRGKGPKGYTRSDERIREDVCDRLSDDDELDASEITVTVKDGEVTLEGTVADRRAKHHAENLADAVSGVRDVHNRLRKDKGMLQEISDRVTGSQDNERGHAGSGTKKNSQ